jgi:DNA polymerase
MSICGLDFETRSEADLLRVGAYAYARHPSTEILWAAWRVTVGDNAPGVIHTWSPKLAKTPPALVNALKNSDRISAFNAAFEHLILTYCGARHGLPQVPLDKWLDTQAIAAMCSLPQSLETLAEHVWATQQKDKRGKQLISMFCSLRAGKYPADHESHPKEFAEFGEYCKQDVATEHAVRLRLPIEDLPLFEQRVWAADVRINDRGAAVDMPFIRGAAALVADAKAEGNALLSNLTGGEITTPGQTKRIREYCARFGCVLPNLKPPTIAAVLADPETHAAARELLELRTAVNLSSLAKYPRMLEAVCADGKLRGLHKYHAAGTGRWTGQIVQFQNPPRPRNAVTRALRGLVAKKNLDLLEIFGSLLFVLRDCIRSSIVPDVGLMLSVSDMSSIEARVLGWMASCPGYLSAFREGRDLYVVTGAAIFGLSYEEVEARYRADENCIERRIGKEVVLGRGYAMGDATFIVTCYNKGVNITQELAARAGKGYKRAYPEIPRLWRAYEDAAFHAIETGEKVRVGVVTLAMFRGFLTVLLPSGRKLWYPEARIGTKQTKYGPKRAILFTGYAGKNKIVESTYGGSLTENFDQAISRDLEAHALVYLDEEGHCPILHTHDEIVCDSPTPSASLARLNQLFTADAPKWAADIPLACKGKLMEFYNK